MVFEFDKELLKLRCKDIQEAASNLFAHPETQPWLSERLSRIIDEARCLELLLEDDTSSGHGRD